MEWQEWQTTSAVKF